jgi:creatinine amidohydrolase/Fe(II)-dependent formamide hydrolase-like protein
MKPSTLPDNSYLYLTSEDDVRQRAGFLPIGSLECHGGSLPLGTDLLIARAFAVAFAHRAEGIVFPEIPYGYCPNTAALPGTVSPRADVFLPYLIEICRQVHRLCERLIVVNIHRGNEAPIALAVDELFQSEGIPIYYLNPYTFLGAAADADLFPGRDNSYKEASLLLAALHLLGDHHADGYVARNDQNSDKPPEMAFLRKHGRLGFSYPNAEAHIAARKDVDIQAGLQFFERAAEKMIDLIAAWRKLEPAG